MSGGFIFDNDDNDDVYLNEKSLYDNDIINTKSEPYEEHLEKLYIFYN